MSTTNQPRYLADAYLESQLSELQNGRKTIRQVCLSLESEVWRNRNAQTTKKTKHSVIGWDKDKLSAAYKATNKQK